MRIIPVLMLAAMTAVPALATDTSSLSGFVKSCASDNKACHSMTLNAIHSARNANYGCIPAQMDPDSAADKLLDWLKYKANENPKYKDDALADLMWTGIDEIWPCKK